MAARVRCGGGNVCLAEHPTPKLVTGNLDNFSNRGDSHRLSISSTPQDKATSTPSLAPAPKLPCSKVIKVTEVISYRSRPKKRATRIDSKVSDLRSSTQSGSAGRDGRCQGWWQVKDEGRQSPVRFLEYPPIRSVAETLRR
jgi:hypothetical protein